MIECVRKPQTSQYPQCIFTKSIIRITYRSDLARRQISYTSMRIDNDMYDVICGITRFPK